MGFKQCLADQCVWKKDSIVIIVYVDDCLVFGNEKGDVDSTVEMLGRLFDITDEGETIEEYLGVKIDHDSDGNFRMYQPHLLKRIINVILGMDKANEHSMPALTTTDLTKDSNGPARTESWEYRSMIGMLNFL
eukprot:5461155-Ditylum_brightwellii.AAC.1